MNTHIPSIQTLLHKTENELSAIFRKATAEAVSTQLAAEEREAARQTAINCRSALNPSGKLGL